VVKCVSKKTVFLPLVRWSLLLISIHNLLVGGFNPWQIWKPGGIIIPNSYMETSNQSWVILGFHMIWIKDWPHSMDPTGFAPDLWPAGVHSVPFFSMDWHSNKHLGKRSKDEMKTDKLYLHFAIQGSEVMFQRSVLRWWFIMVYTEFIQVFTVYPWCSFQIAWVYKYSIHFEYTTKHLKCGEGWWISWTRPSIPHAFIEAVFSTISNILSSSHWQGRVKRSRDNATNSQAVWWIIESC
jgi:hypothetical protein